VPCAFYSEKTHLKRTKTEEKVVTVKKEDMVTHESVPVAQEICEAFEAWEFNPSGLRTDRVAKPGERVCKNCGKHAACMTFHPCRHLLLCMDCCKEFSTTKRDCIAEHCTSNVKGATFTDAGSV